MNEKIIYQQMAAIMSDASFIGKTQKNKEQGFMFRGIDDLYNALHSILAKHQVFTTSKIEHAERFAGQTKSGTAFVDQVLTVSFTFWAVDGSSVSTEIIGAGRDYADKYASKAMAIAHKYALLQVFAIPTNDPENDPDLNTIEGATKKVTKPKPELLPDDEISWGKVQFALKSGYTIEQVKTKWEISLENQKKLLQ